MTPRNESVEDRARREERERAVRICEEMACALTNCFPVSNPVLHRALEIKIEAACELARLIAGGE